MDDEAEKDGQAALQRKLVVLATELAIRVTGLIELASTERGEVLARWQTALREANRELLGSAALSTEELLRCVLRASALWLLPAPWPHAHGVFGPGSRVSAGARDEAPASDAAPEVVPAEGPAFASYRSSGGHAAAQVAKPR